MIENSGKGERVYDIYSRLLKDRIIFISSTIDEDCANAVVAQLLFLEAEDHEADIKIYINSPGGIVSAGLAIYDTMKYVKNSISTFAIGHAASMAAVLLCAGEKGKRYILPNAEVMIHQPSGGVEGQASDIKIAAERIIKNRAKLISIIAQETGHPVEDIARDCDRDYWLDAEECVKYGIVDTILTP